MMQCRFTLSILTLLTQLFAVPAYAQNLDQSFETWVNTDLRAQASAQGISKTTFDLAFAGVKLKLDLPDLIDPTKNPSAPSKQHQAEFSSPAKYFSEKSIAPLVSGGKSLGLKHAKTLVAIEKKFGVPAPIILAIWGRESGFGKAQGSHPGFDVLSTKAFMSTRKDLFLKETLAALQIIEKGYATPEIMKTSWAGAFGQPQFLPSSYLEHAVDFDGDGRRDIWNSVPDTLASIANYLANYGWERARGWGTLVSIPETVSCALEGPDKGKPLSQWIEAGLRLKDDNSFTQSELTENHFLMSPAGRNGPMFMVTPNFYVIKNYNVSDLYALFIGHVADRIANDTSAFTVPWGPVDKLNRADVAAMQRFLVEQGYDVGKPDGLAGFKTRRSIGDWQVKNGMAATCFPSLALKRVLK